MTEEEKQFHLSTHKAAVPQLEQNVRQAEHDHKAISDGMLKSSNPSAYANALALAVENLDEAKGKLEKINRVIAWLEITGHDQVTPELMWEKAQGVDLPK